MTPYWGGYNMTELIVISIGIITNLILLLLVIRLNHQVKLLTKTEGKITNLTDLTDNENLIPPRSDEEEWRICQERKGLPTE